MKDKVENKRYEKNIKLFKWLAILSIFPALGKLIIDPDIFTGSGKTIDFLMLLVPIGMYFNYRKTANNWGGQFIEWTEDTLSFKSRKYKETTIYYTEIQRIEITLNLIKITTSDMVYEINIEDYKDYDTRIKLKNNFNKLNEKLRTI